MPHHIYGDSNVDRFLPLVKEKKSDPQIQSTTYTKTTNAVLLREALSHPVTAHSIIVIASLTNLLTAKFVNDYDMLVDHCNTVFRDVLLWVEEGRTALPGFASQVHFILFYFGLCPFSAIFVKCTPPCLHYAFLHSHLEYGRPLPVVPLPVLTEVPLREGRLLLVIPLIIFLGFHSPPMLRHFIFTI